ncbi:hypothetical protein [Rhodopirellula baltica]|nr:hypothetical protein [Rhodopirellula baltica]
MIAATALTPIVCKAQNADPFEISPPTVGYEYRLDIHIDESIEGVFVRSLLPNSPTQRLRLANANPPVIRALRPGDQITHLNGRIIRNGQGLRDASDASHGNVRLTIKESDTLRTRDWDVDPVVITLTANRTAATSQASGVKPVLFAILIADTQDETIGNGAKVSLDQISEQLKQLISKDQLELTILDEDDCNPEKIIRELGVIPSTDADSVFVYYLGHGAFDPLQSQNDPSRGHFMDFKRKDLLRRTVWKYLNAAPAKFRAVVTDACNVQGEADPFEYRMELRARTMQIVGATGLEWLLLGHRGQIDLSAADFGQFAWYSNERGGFFSNQWVQVASDVSLTDWSPFLSQVGQASNKYYVAERERILANPGSIPTDTLARLRSQTSMRTRLFRNQVRRDALPPVNPQLRRMITTTHTTAVPFHENN